MQCRSIHWISVLLVLAACRPPAGSEQEPSMKSNDMATAAAREEIAAMSFLSSSEEQLFESRALSGFIYIDSASYIRGVESPTYNALRDVDNVSGDHEEMLQRAVGWAKEEAIQVTVPYDYFMQETHVTNGEFQEFVDRTGYITFAERFGTGHVMDPVKRLIRGSGHTWDSTLWPLEADQPVSHICFVDAMAYAAWLSEELHVMARPPTVEEWELAMRSSHRLDEPSIFPWGNEIGDLGMRMNFADRSADPYPWRHDQFDDGSPFVSPVRSFPANDRGIYDAVGNNWIWTCTSTEDIPSMSQDTYVSHPMNFSFCDVEKLEIRGGCSLSRVQHCNLLGRIGLPPTESSNDTGFRLVVVRRANFGTAEGY